MTTPEITEMFDIDPDEVHAVQDAANGFPFLMFKSESTGTTEEAKMAQQFRDQTFIKSGNPAEDHALHDQFLKATASRSLPPYGSPYYQLLRGAYDRHEARTNGAGMIGGTEILKGADSPLSDVLTQEAMLTIITDTINAAREAIGANDGGMAKARAEMLGITRLMENPSLGRQLENQSPMEKSRMRVVRQRLEEIAKSRAVTIDDAKQELSALGGNK